MRLTRLVVLGVLVAGLWLAPAAQSADRSVLEGYGGNASTPVIEVQSANEPSAPAGSTLPFTGLDVVWFALAGGALVLVGLGVRRVGSDRS
jgi:hypothetical protein